MTTDTIDTETDAPRANQLVRRNFEGVTLAHENAATQALIAKATADVQSRWIMAMRAPRDLANVRQMIIKECRRPGFAKVAIYAVPRGEKQIRGLSIRFAEVAMRCMSNMGCEAVTIYDSDEERIVRVTATDFETNATWSRDLSVKKTIERRQLRKNQRALRERINSYGDRVFIVEATDDEVAVKEAAMISKAARTAVLRLIPGHLQDEAFEMCDKIAHEEAAKDPDGERNKILDAFAELNVMPSALGDWLGHPFEQTTPAELVELRKLYAALRDGELSWSEALETAGEVRERAKKAAAEKRAAAPAQQAAAPAATPAATSTPATTAPTTAPTTTPATSAPTSTATDAKKGGKGSQAVKDKIAAGSAPPATPATTTAKPAAAAPPPATPAPTPTLAAPNHNIHDPNAEPPPNEAVATLRIVPPEASDDGDLDVEERKCAKCGVAIETLKSDPPGAKCYACRQGD